MIPMLKELFQNKKNELELRIIALQILQPLQVAIMSASTFKMYSGVDIYKREERRKFIDTLVNNVARDARGDEACLLACHDITPYKSEQDKRG